MSFILSCCSTVDLSPAHMEERKLYYIPLHYYLSGHEYSDDMWQSMSCGDFYSAMLAGADTRTSQVNTSEYTAYFTPFLEQGLDILHVCLSSGLSGTYTSASLAVEEVREKYPDRKILLVDSLCASGGYGMLMDDLADARDAGVSIEECAELALSSRLHIHHKFFSTDLSFYVRGGRIPKSAGFVGTLLGICPFMDMNDHGELKVREKIRSKKRVLLRMADAMEEEATDGAAYCGKCFIGHSDCIEDAQALAELIENRFPKCKKPEIYPIGPVIGSHSGPGTVALFFRSEGSRLD